MTSTTPKPTRPEATLVELLRARAAEAPRRRTYTFLADGETAELGLDNGDLDLRARTVAATLREFAAEGDRALLLYPPGLDFVVGFFGCLYAGLVAVPTFPPDPSRLAQTLPRFTTIVGDARPTVVLTCSTVLPLLEAMTSAVGELRDLRPVATDAADASLASKWSPPAAAAQSVALLQYTSGSTGTPRGVALTHHNLLSQQRILQRAFNQTERSVVVGWLPPYHDMGLIGHLLQPLHSRGRLVFMSPIDFLKRPVRWLQAISRYQGTTSAAPNFAYDLCVRKVTLAQREALDLRSWTEALNGSEPISHAAMTRFAEAFAPCGFRWEAFRPCYGLAEATLCVSGNRDTPAPSVRTVSVPALRQGRMVECPATAPEAQQLVGCGHVVDGVRVVIADADTGQPCPPGAVGEILVSGPGVAQGYWNRPEETAHVFAASVPAVSTDTFLRTGDLGFLDGEELFVVGRIKEMIVVRGANHYPQDIERTVEGSDPVIRPGCVAAFAADGDGEEQLVVVAEVDPAWDPGHDPAADPKALFRAIQRAVGERHGVALHATLLIPARTLPKTSSGKVRRRACAELFRIGGLPVVAQWQHGDPLGPARPWAAAGRPDAAIA